MGFCHPLSLYRILYHISTKMNNSTENYSVQVRNVSPVICVDTCVIV